MNREQWKNLYRAYRVLSLYRYDEGWDNDADEKLDRLPDCVKTGQDRHPARGWKDQWGYYIWNDPGYPADTIARRRKYYLQGVKNAMYSNVRKVR